MESRIGELCGNDRTDNQGGRRIGYHFARISLPKMAFGPLFNTLSMQFTGIMAHISETPGYYWMNASWGTSSIQGHVRLRDRQRLRQDHQSRGRDENVEWVLVLVPGHARHIDHHIDHVPGQYRGGRSGRGQHLVRAQRQVAQWVWERDGGLPRPYAAGIDRDGGVEQDRYRGQSHVERFGHEYHNGQQREHLRDALG